jgi:hypothetical protein
MGDDNPPRVTAPYWATFQKLWVDHPQIRSTSPLGSRREDGPSAFDVRTIVKQRSQTTEFTRCSGHPVSVQTRGATISSLTFVMRNDDRR